MTDADPRAEIETLRSGLTSHGEDARYVQWDADREHLLRMSDNIRLVPSEIGDHRHLKLLRHVSRIAALAPPPTVQDFEENAELEAAAVQDADDVDALLDEHGLLGLALEYRAAADAIVRWINTEYDNEHTNQDYRTAIRSFGRYRLKREEPPDSLAWIPTGTSNDFDPVPSERDLLTFDTDIDAMLEAARNPRDTALFAVQFEAGLRGGELYDLRVGDVFESEHATGLHVDGKQGERAVHLIVSVPYLQQWLNDDRCETADDAWLWSKLSSSDRPSYPTFLNYFKNAAERAGISKEVTPTNFRKSNTRWLILLGFDVPRIEERQGRKRGSEHTARYMARFGDESNERAYARLHGLDVGEEDQSDEVGPIDCPRCHRETPRERDFCMWCRFALSHDAAETLDETVDTAVDELIDADSEVARRMFGEFIKFIQERPDRLPGDAQELLTSSFDSAE